jgi:hypothetical protein
MTKQFYTYLYRDPKDGTPIYIGKGFNKRAWEHQYDLGTHLSHTLRKRIREGYVPTPTINFEVDEQSAMEMEKFWIDFYGRKDLGTGTLFNLTSGGEGASNPSKEVIEARASKIRGVPRSQEVKDKISKANCGRTRTEEEKQAMSARSKAAGCRPPARKGSRLTDEQKAKLKGRTPWNKGLSRKV